MQALILKAGDKTVWNKLMQVAEDPGSSRDDRLAALAVGTWWVHDPIPAAAERFACEELAAGHSNQGIYQILVALATEQSRPTIAAALAQALRDAQDEAGGSRTRAQSPRRSVANDPEEPSNLCEVGWCVATLRRIRSSESVSMLRDVASLPMNSE